MPDGSSFVQREFIQINKFRGLKYRKIDLPLLLYIKNITLEMAPVAVCVTMKCKVTYCRPRSNFEMFVSLSAGNYNDTMGTCYTQKLSYLCYAKHLKVISVVCHENNDVPANFEVK